MRDALRHAWLIAARFRRAMNRTNQTQPSATMKAEPSINLLIPVSIVAAIALSACGGKKKDEQNGKSTPPEPTTEQGYWEQIQHEHERGNQTHKKVWDVLDQL